MKRSRPRAVADAATPKLKIKDAAWELERSDRGNAVVDFLDFASSLRVEPWQTQGSCASSGNPDAWFPPQGRRDSSTRAAMRTCRLCPVAAECFSFAMNFSPRVQGIWAGTTELERRAILQDKGRQ